LDPHGLAAMSAARDFTARRFGALTAPTSIHVLVGVAPVIIRPNNPNCIGVIVNNVGSTKIVIGYDPTIDSTHGLILGGNGAAFYSVVQYDGDLVGYPLYAISDVEGGEVFIIETNQVLVSAAGGS
ncbi:MAG: hypothetical protein ACREHG_09680, partial [Candidatus Saccharimonadales bacterium]